MRCLGDPGRQFGVLDRPGHFGFEQPHTANVQHRQYCNDENHHTQAAQPLQKLAIKQKGPGHLVETGQYGRAGCCNCTDRFENRIHKGNMRHHDDRNGAQHSHYYPGESGEDQ